MLHLLVSHLGSREGIEAALRGEEGGEGVGVLLNCVQCRAFIRAFLLFPFLPILFLFHKVWSAQ